MKIEEMVKSMYSDLKVRSAIIKDAKSRGTVAKIEAGELALPSETDAIEFTKAQEGK